MKKSIVLTLIVALLLAMTTTVFADPVLDENAKPINVKLNGSSQGSEFNLTVSFSEPVYQLSEFLRYNNK